MPQAACVQWCAEFSAWFLVMQFEDLKDKEGEGGKLYLCHVFQLTEENQAHSTEYEIHFDLKQ